MLVQTVPASAKDDVMAEIIEYLGVIARQVDSTLLDEWEKLKRGGGSVSAVAEVTEAKPEEYDITRHKRGFSVAIRNEAFQYIKALAYDRLQMIVDLGKANRGDSPWTLDGLRELMTLYRSDHEGPLTDRRSRAGELFQLKDGTDTVYCEQLLCDSEGHNDWKLAFTVDIAASRAAGKPVMMLTEFSPV